ncbi:hypothetical protein [Adhaeribacter soli]|uniref:DNA-directed DNA polymerase family A palm domain-containing protein n=1 Tax=Adhaeribacter soli TaxID=2607655 RepID=A0A5N1ISP0_9BACT|nr:hypothetical protein [Adhaeribacter soli]KAA9332678.1 hypothetical protein F0P94_11765 [Adhaeribacter soli]
MLLDNRKPIHIYSANDDLKEKVTEYYWNEIDEQKKSKNKLINYLDTHLDKYKYLLHYIYFMTIVKKLKLCEDYIPISNQKFEELFGRRYYYSIMRFLNKYYIEHDGTYFFDKNRKNIGKCRGYRFKKEFYLNTCFYQDILINEKFENKLRINRAKNFSELDNITVQIENSLQMLNIRFDDSLDSVIRKSEADSLVLLDRYPNQLSLTSFTAHGRSFVDIRPNIESKDWEKIKSVLEFNKEKNNLKKKKLSPHLRSLKRLLKDVISFKTSISSRIASINRVNNKEQSAIRPLPQNRVHTNLTNMASDLRPYLYLEENPNIELVSLDVSNSQPFVLVKLILDFIDSQCYFVDHTTQMYIDLVSNGKFYSHMKSLLNSADCDKIFKQRMFGRIFYDEHKNCIRTQEWKVFCENFPIVAQAIEEKKKSGYEKLSLEMQEIEAQINIDGVLRELYHKYPDTFFNHIHDSIIFPSGFETEVKALMEYHYNRVVGYIPNIKDPVKLNDINLSLAA